MVRSEHFLTKPTRFPSPQIEEKIATKGMSFGLFMFQTKLPQHHQMLVLSFLSFLVFLLFKCFLSLLLYGSFSMLRCVSLTYLLHLLFFLGAHLFLFSPDTSFGFIFIFIFIIIIIIIIIIVVLGSWIIKFPFIHYLF